MSASPQRRIETLERRLRDAMPGALGRFVDTLAVDDRMFTEDLIRRGKWESMRGLSKSDKVRAMALRARLLAFVLMEMKRT